MRTGRIAIAALVLVVLAAGGAYAFGVVGKPAVSDVDNRFAGVNETTTLIRTNVTIENPNPIGIDAGGVVLDYTVDLGGIRMADGGLQDISIATGNDTISLLTAMDNERIPPWWVSHIRSGERSTLEVHVDVRSSTLGRGVSVTPVKRPIETDILSGFNSTETRAVNADRTLVEDPVLYVNETAGWWGSVTESETPIEMRFRVYNPKDVAYTVTGIGYDITMNDVEMGAGETDRAHVLEPHTTTTIDATTVLQNDRLDEWWVSHLENNQVTDLRIDFYVTIKLPTGQTIRVPLEELAHTQTIETDMFGTKPSSGSPPSTPTAADEPTPTEDAATDSAVPSGSEALSTVATDAIDLTSTDEQTGSAASTATAEEGTPTATPTPTETDDGLL